MLVIPIKPIHRLLTTGAMQRSFRLLHNPFVRPTKFVPRFPDPRSGVAPKHMLRTSCDDSHLVPTNGCAQIRRHRWYNGVESDVMEAVRLRRDFAAPAFFAPGIAGGAAEERSYGGDAGGYDAHM